MKAVAVHPTQVSQRQARNRPITKGLVISAITLELSGKAIESFEREHHGLVYAPSGQNQQNYV